MGRGLAASGGCPPLFELQLQEIRTSIDVLAYEPSLIVPSVRRLQIHGGYTDPEPALLLCCGLVQMGYKHRFINEVFTDQKYRSCIAAVLKAGGIHADA
jgi:hypothetical protein